MCALYSLDEEHNRDAAEVLCSIFVEEMLHLTLVANLLNAIGGRPRFAAAQMMQGYPRCLPHGDPAFEISLLPFGIEALQQFLRIERPARRGAPAQEDRYETIGQFYAAISEGLYDLCAALGEEQVFSGDPARQVPSSFSYGGAGSVIAVHDFASAMAALTEIVEQGEGASDQEVWDGDRNMFHPDRYEVAHFYRIQELLLGRRYQSGDTPHTGPTGDAIEIVFEGEAVRPMRRNPLLADLPSGHPTRTTQEAFNRTYARLLDMLDHAFDGHPESLGDAVGVMYELKSHARTLLVTPYGGGHSMAGPTFEYIAPEISALNGDERDA
jgi:hypothetical protein